MRHLFALLVWLLFTSPCVFAANSVTQHGITWTFASDHTVGQFVNGDYYVIDSGSGVTIEDITPHTTVSPVKNGSMLDRIDWYQGFDDRYSSGEHYRSASNIATGIVGGTPLTLTGDHSIISTISRTTVSAGESYVQTAAILTILTSVPPSGCFRPGPSGTTKTLYNFNNINKSLLKNLVYAGKPNMTGLIAHAKMPFLNLTQYMGRFYRPMDWFDWNGIDSYYWQRDTIALLALGLHLDYSTNDKDAMLTNLIQVGIDLFSQLKTLPTPAGWSPDGGSNNGAKLPIVFAATMLNDSEMLGYLRKSGKYIFENGKDQTNLPTDYIQFGEDAVFYINQKQVDITNTLGWKGYNTLRNQGVDYPYTSAMIGMPEWINQNNYNWGDCNSEWQTSYRTIGSGGGNYFVQAMMATLLLDGGKTAWNNPAFFDYVDRFMAISSTNIDPFGYTVPNQVGFERPTGFTAYMYDTFRTYQFSRKYKNVKSIIQETP